MLKITTEIAPHEVAFLELEAAASAPYTQFVFGTAAQSLGVRHVLLANHAAEFAPPHARLLLEGGRLVGMMAALRGPALVHCRLRAAWVLKQQAVLEGDPATERALHLASQTLLKPRPDDYYLSRIAVQPTERGRGLAGLLLRHFEQEGQDCGARRLVLEVDPANAGAMNLYVRLGFVEVERVRVEDVDRQRHLEYAHLAKPLAG